VRGFEPAGMRPGAPVFRAVAMLSGRSGQLDLFRNMPIPQASGSISLEELFEAYASCRKHKRCTASALAFEVDYEHELCRLLKEINCGEWKPGRVAAFIVDRPVKREILASPFRDRIVHHLLHAKLNPLFERAFNYDSYSCRTGKGTLLGIRRLERFIRSCSRNHTHPVFVLKIDISGFFMNISRSRLYALLEAFLLARYTNSDLPVVLALVQKVVFHDPVSHCVIRSPFGLDRIAGRQEHVSLEAGPRSAHREPDKPVVRQFLPERVRPFHEARSRIALVWSVCG